MEFFKSPSRSVSPTKDQRFLVELLVEMENKFDVNSIFLEGVRVWPLVRLLIGRAFKQADNISDAGMANHDNSVATSANPNSMTGMTSVSPKNREERVHLAREHELKMESNPVLAYTKFRKDLDQIAGLGRPKFTVLGKVEKYYLEKEDGFFSPILDPASEDLSSYGKVVRLALEPFRKNCVHPPLVIDLSAYIACHDISDLEIPSDTDNTLKEIERFLKSKWPENPFKRRMVYGRFRRLRLRRGFFYEIFSKLNPECIVVSSFTGWLHALWAAKDLGIPVIDVQHGGQGPIHLSTTHFSDVPESGYHFLPDIIWLWGESNREFASAWLPGSAKRHIPVVGGHRGVAHWKRDLEKGILPPLDQEFVNKYYGGKNILVTLSYAISPLFPSELVDAVHKTPWYHWLIRLHPIHRSDTTVAQINLALKNLGCQNFSIEDVTEVQLQTALHVSQAHLTPFSTSIRESFAFGVPSAITHPIGERIFREEIATGSLFYTPNSKSVIKFVKKCLEKDNTQKHLAKKNIDTSDLALKRVLEATVEVKRNAPDLTSKTPLPNLPFNLLDPK